MLKDRLREARKAAGMTQKEVATAIGVTESAYCGYETGKRQPDVLKIKQIAEVLGTTGDFLLETPQDQEPDLAEYLSDLRDRPETRALLEASRGMTKEQVEAMAALAKQLRGNTFESD